MTSSIESSKLQLYSYLGTFPTEKEARHLRISWGFYDTTALKFAVCFYIFYPLDLYMSYIICNFVSLNQYTIMGYMKNLFLEFQESEIDEELEQMLYEEFLYRVGNGEVDYFTEPIENSNAHTEITDSSCVIETYHH
jgi:hypothetical protein